MSAADPIIIVGASLAGLRAAEALRDKGYRGHLVMVSDEEHEPYDRPPLSKQVGIGMQPPEGTVLPRQRAIAAEWRLGRAAEGLDLAGQTVLLAGGERLGFHRLLIATGVRARPWVRPDEALLGGVLTLRSREDASRLRAALVARPRHVVVIGGGFNGSEIASVCRELELSVTLVEHNGTPLAGAFGLVVGRAAASLQRASGVDLRCGLSVDHLEGHEGRVRRVHLSDGTAIDADLVIVALGSLPNVEWLDGCGLAVGPHGVSCDAGCRAFDHFGIATDTIYVAGDVARFPHPLFNYEFMTLEHWGNAVAQARIAAHNMLAGQGTRLPHIGVPTFWSSQFDISIKSVGVPAAGDAVAIVQGSLESRRFVAVYGRMGRIVAAVTFDQGKWLQRYEALIEEGAAFPCSVGMDAPPATAPVPAEFPRRSKHGLDAFITLSGHSPDNRHATLKRTAPPALRRDTLSRQEVRS